MAVQEHLICPKLGHSVLRDSEPFESSSRSCRKLDRSVEQATKSDALPMFCNTVPILHSCSVFQGQDSWCCSPLKKSTPSGALPVFWNTFPITQNRSVLLGQDYGCGSLFKKSTLLKKVTQERTPQTFWCGPLSVFCSLRWDVLGSFTHVLLISMVCCR